MPVDQPCNVYWEQLFPLGYGHALWEPNPIEYFYDQVSIGDVGYVLDGFFQRMFNVTLPSDDPSNQRYNVPPPPYKPLDIGPNIRRSILAEGTYYSNSVCAQSNHNDPSAMASSDLEGFTYKCRGRGALLFLPHDGHREDAICARLFKDHIRENVESWFEWSKKRGLDIERIEDLILVSGRTLAPSWGAAVFLDHGQEETAISLAVHTLPNGGGRFLWRLINRLVPHRNSQLEPDNSSPKLNQCVFIKGFRAKRGFPWFKRIRAAAEPLPDDPDDSSEDEIQVTGVPGPSEYRDPLVGVLDYILEKCPEDSIAIAHDDDLQLVENVEALTAGRVERFLHENEIPVVVEDGVAFLHGRHGDVIPVRDGQRAKFPATAELRGEQAHSPSSSKPRTTLAKLLAPLRRRPTHERSSFSAETSRIPPPPPSLFVNEPVLPRNRQPAPAPKSPPPAPAATSAKRARGLRGDDMIGQYRRPAFHALVSGGSPPNEVLGGTVENFRANMLLSTTGTGTHDTAFVNDATSKPAGWSPTVTEQQMIMKELSGGAPDPDADVLALADFHPPTMYHATIPLVSERPHNTHWNTDRLLGLRVKIESNTISDEEIEQVAADVLDGEIVDLVSDRLGSIVVQKLFENCAFPTRMAMLDHISPHLAIIGVHKTGTWAAQKIIECAQTPEEINIIVQHLRPYTPPLLLDRSGNYVIQCCLRFGQPANDFIFDAMVDRLWEIAQGRFGARSMRACLESPNITISQQRRVTTAIILNSIPLATNPNGALLLTWLLDTSGFTCRYRLLAPRFTPHLSHLCTHKLASRTVLRIVNQKVEPEASGQVIEALFSSPNDHVLTDVLGDQVNGVTVVYDVLTSPFVDQAKRLAYIEATKRVLIELKVIATQAYRRLIEEVGLPIPYLQPNYPNSSTTPGAKGKFGGSPKSYGFPDLSFAGYTPRDQNPASMMATLQMGGQSPQSGSPQLSRDFMYGKQSIHRRSRSNAVSVFSPADDQFNTFARSSKNNTSRIPRRRSGDPSPAAAASSSTTTPTMGAFHPQNQHWQ